MYPEGESSSPQLLFWAVELSPVHIQALRNSVQDCFIIEREFLSASITRQLLAIADPSESPHILMPTVRARNIDLSVVSRVILAMTACDMVTIYNRSSSLPQSNRRPVCAQLSEPHQIVHVTTQLPKGGEYRLGGGAE
jgi:hypothetical protein